MAETRDGEPTAPPERGGLDAIAFPPIARPQPRRRAGLILALIFLLLLLAGASAGGWYLFAGSRETAREPGDVPLLRADPRPVRVRPDSPGGMQIPDQDRLVYDRMRGAGEQPVERLLPPPEAPLPPPQPAPGQAGSPPVAQGPVASGPQSLLPPPSTAARPTPAPAVQTPTTPTQPPPPPAAAATLPPAGPAAVPSGAAPASAPPESMSPAPVVAPPPPAVPATPPPPPAQARATAPPPGPATMGGHLVQLGALRTPEQASAAWEQLVRRHGDLLGRFQPIVVRVDLGPGKGVFYRVRVGPFADEGQARAMCAALAERKADCAVVRPGG